jgi:hypothetical protein
MPANINPIFPLVGNNATCSIAAANTARDGSGALIDLITGATYGTVVYNCTCMSAQATLAAFASKVVNFFKTDSSGLNPRLIESILMTGATPSTVLASVKYIIYFSNGLILKNGEKIQVCQTVYASAADKTDVYANAVDY